MSAMMKNSIPDCGNGTLKSASTKSAHMAAAGGLSSGGASFSYQVGANGRSYAIGGHVNIDTSREATPEATMAKMLVVMSAAMAPADPSPQDLKVAAHAAKVMQEVRMEMAEDFRDMQQQLQSNPVAAAFAQAAT